MNDLLTSDDKREGIRFTRLYLDEVSKIAEYINSSDIMNMIWYLYMGRKNKGRLFILGVGGSAGTASHAVNDFRKIVGIESYAVTDNVSELTALINDDGWENSYKRWLEESNLNENDLILIYSVGGGSIENNLSISLIRAVEYAKKQGCYILSIVGRDGGFVGKNSDARILIPTVSTDRITPHVEGFASVVTHLIVSHPLLKLYPTTWEEKDNGKSKEGNIL